MLRHIPFVRPARAKQAQVNFELQRGYRGTEAGVLRIMKQSAGHSRLRLGCVWGQGGCRWEKSHTQAVEARTGGYQGGIARDRGFWPLMERRWRMKVRNGYWSTGRFICCSPDDQTAPSDLHWSWWLHTHFSFSFVRLISPLGFVILQSDAPDR